jgi:hypothetical protein
MMAEITKFWKITPIPFRVDPVETLICPREGCGNEMLPGVTQTVRFQLDLHGDREHSHAFDNWVRCVGCGFTTIFGLAVPEDEYREIMEHYVKKVKMNEKEFNEYFEKSAES